MSSHQSRSLRSETTVSWFASWGDHLYPLVMFVWIAAVLVRLTVRDLSPFAFVTVLYYVSPGILLFLAAGVIALYMGLVRRYRTAATWCVMALVVAQCAGSHRILSQKDPNRLQQPKRYSLLLWNTCHGRHGWENIARELSKHRADIIALVEAGPPTETMRAFWKKHFPDYDISLLGGEMVLLTRGTSTAVRAARIGWQGQVREVELILDGHRLITMVVDIHGRPDLPRGEAIRMLASLLETRRSDPVLVAGDFNTPSESPLFQPVRQQGVNAFEVAGRGYSPTWPWILPVLVLDQIWGNQQVRFDDCHTVWSQASDHSAVIAEFHFE